ncbi:MAG: Tad domain-containing protein [Candidatus Hydrogenedentota bacterium]
MRTISRTDSSRKPDQLSPRAGIATVWTVLFVLVLVMFLGLVIDTGYMVVAKQQLQTAADAAALAGAYSVRSDQDDARSQAVLIASLNTSAKENVTLYLNSVNDPNGDIVVGFFDRDTETFTPTTTDPNAVEVNACRTTAHGTNTPLTLLFGDMMGITEVDIAAKAIAMSDFTDSGGAVRFLIDDEMIDTDIPVLEDLASDLGITTEDLISDLDGDWFIDLPPGTILELPTGQIGDEGLFEIQEAHFPFTEESDPSLEDFLNWQDDSSSWRYYLLDDDDNDPLLGVSPVDDASVYLSYVDPNFVHISPIYKSDTSTLDPTWDDTGFIESVNAKGERRGLLAFKIIAIGTDSDGSGSVLPNIVIEVVDPSGIDLGNIGPTETVVFLVL